MTDNSSPRRRPAPAAAGRPYHHGNLRGAILDAALDVLGRRQPSELSLRELARAAGVRHSALYAHFRDRDELLAVIAGEGFRVLATELRAASAEASGDQLSALAAAYLRFARANPAHYRTMFRPENMLPANARHVDEAADECFRILTDILTERPGIRQEEAVERAVGIWSTVHGLALLGDNSGPLHQKIPRDREAPLAEKFVQVLARGDWPHG